MIHENILSSLSDTVKVYFIIIITNWNNLASHRILYIQYRRLFFYTFVYIFKTFGSFETYICLSCHPLLILSYPLYINIYSNPPNSPPPPPPPFLPTFPVSVVSRRICVSWLPPTWFLVMPLPLFLLPDSTATSGEMALMSTMPASACWRYINFGLLNNSAKCF